jgi:hypothetical protein
VCSLLAGISQAQTAAEKAAQPAERGGAAQADAAKQAPATSPARPAVDAAKPAAAPADPTGSWKWEITTPDDNAFELMLKLKWDGKKLAGKYTAFDSTVDIEESKLEKDAITFVVRPEFGGNQFEVKFNGKVAKDEIKGKIIVDFGDQPQEIDWLAKRFLDVDDVLGTWQLTLETPDGMTFEPTLTVTKDDKGLHAKTASDFGEFEGKNVQIKDNQFVFEISSENDEFSFKSVYRATPRGNVVEGKSEFDFGGNKGEMKFTGKRLPPKEEKKAEPARPTAGDAGKSKQPAGESTKSSDK